MDERGFLRHVLEEQIRDPEPPETNWTDAQPPSPKRASKTLQHPSLALVPLNPYKP